MLKNIKKVLIANRGEISYRVIRACKKINIPSVAIYSDVDYNFLPAIHASESVSIGNPISSESYLNTEKILSAIKSSGANAVHPGYGFLSENTRFAKLLEDNGIIFVGPNSKAIDMMGDKITSKKIAKEAGVSTVPGYDGAITDENHAIQVAKQIGFPVMLKASAGGGGKGIRIATNEEDIKIMFVSVKNEAKKSFSDDTIFVEKYIENPRHIEIQVIADKHGNVVCLGERECSIQRNHQKIIEEAPSSFITPEVRAEMYKQSTLLAKKVGYDSAGTVEYIVDKNKNFYFLEMNTRLQVEHPVTEFVTGYDLVELMLKIADGQKLPFTQSDVKLNGHSFEARICSEDPSKNFLPSTGWLYDYKEPEKSDVVRVDTGIKEGCFITQYYDPMIAKLIVYGKTREEARKTLLSSLGEFYISGVETNITFLENIIMNQDFINGNISTNFIKQKYQNNYNPKQINEEFTPYFAIASLFVFCSLNSNANDRKQYVSIVQGKNVKITLMSFTTTEMKVTLNDISYSIKTTDNMPFSPIKKILKLKINDTEYKFRTKVDGIFISLSGLGLSASTTVIDGNFSILLDHIQNNLGNSGENYSELEVPIAGVVTQVYVKEGQIVDSGSPLMTIEAMKMENFIFADFKTKIKKINYKIGDVVSVGNIAIEFDNADSLCVSESASEHTSSNDPSLIKESNSSVGASGNSDSYVKSGLKN